MAYSLGSCSNPRAYFFPVRTHSGCCITFYVFVTAGETGKLTVFLIKCLIHASVTEMTEKTIKTSFH